MASEFFGRRRECRFYTAGCGNKMVVSVTGPRAVNELGGPVIPGSSLRLHIHLSFQHHIYEAKHDIANCVMPFQRYNFV